ncbi:unnamed protein product [Adineta steineri]|uniref:Uncharacterized protein n=1 Tax=Adineta steineri TaxID=433720 RepID=A0A815MFJ6_9BILA|nr:unnamed protein product [Adineta steineri]
MYQEKFQEKEDNGSVEIKKSHNVDIQCNLNYEDSNWNNDWNADTTISIQDQPSNEPEIIRLKTIIEEIQNENENLRVLSNCINNQSISINTFTQTETENENNDWNEDVTIPQISTEDQTSNEQEIIRLKAIIDEIQNENENLRVLSNCINNQSISINTFTQTENEDNNEISSVKDDSSKQIVDNQTQTDDQPQDKLTQVNTKLKRALQTIKDKINRIVIEQLELFPESTDDTIVRLDHLISAIEQQAIQIDLLKTKSDILIPTLSVQEIEQIMEERNQLQNEKLTNNEEINNLRSQLVERDEQLQELNEKYSEIVSNVEKPSIETVDNETQTDEQQKDKLAQINNKLKRALQNIKEKIQRIVNEKPELFINSSDDTVERLDNLLSAIEILQNERDHALQKIDQLQNTNRDQIDNMSSSITVQSNSEDSLPEDYQKQIDQLQKHLSQKDEERSLLRERLNEVEVEFRKTLDDHESTVNKYEFLKQERDDEERSLLRERLNEVEVEFRKTLDDHESTVNKYEFLKQERDVLIEQHTSQTDEYEHQIELLQEEVAQLKQASTLPTEDLQSTQEIIEQQTEELKDLTEKYLSQTASQDELNRQKQEIEERLHERDNQLENLIKERTILLEQLEKSTVSSPVETTDNESQTEDRQQDKLAQVNNKLKRALQGIKDKIHRVVNEKPDLFDGVSQDTAERLDHLISTVENQAAYINILQSERDQAQEQLQNSMQTPHQELDNERQTEMEQLTSSAPLSSPSIVNDYQQQIHQLQQNLSQKDEHQNLLQENLNKVEAELEQIRNDYSSIVTEYELLVQHQTQESQNSQLEIQQLKAAADLKQSIKHEHIETQTDEDINALYELIEEQSQQMKDLNEMTSILSSQLESQIDINKEKKEMEEQLANYKNELENFMQERTTLLEEIAKSKSSPSESADNETQTEDRQQDKLAQVNTKLKRALQGIKDKVHRIVTERPELFDDVGEDTSERLEHLISTVQDQAAQINILQSERYEANQKYEDELKRLQSSLEASQYELDNEHRVKVEQLVRATPPDDNSPSAVEDYRKQIDQLQKHLSQKDEERSLLRERLNEVEVEFRKALDDHESTVNKYEFLKQERNVLVEQQEISTTESQNKIEELENELDQLKQSAITQHAQIQTDKNIQSLEKVIEQQSQQIIDLNDKNTELLSQLESHAKLDHEKEQTEKQLAHYQKHLKDLLKQNTNLIEELEKSTVSSPVETADNETQTDERQQEKLAQVNNKLKRALQGIKDKIYRIVNEKPDLFDGVSEDTSERLEHLISTVENQAAYINILQSERDEVQEQLTSPSVENSSSIVDDYQQQIHQLQQNLLEKDEQQSLLQENLNKAEAELEQIRNDYSSIVTEYELLVQHQTQESQNSQHEIQQLKEAVDQKQSVKHEHAETQTHENIIALHELIEEQSQQIKELNEINNEKKELEERLNERETQIQNLMQEIAKSKSSHIDTADNESQTDELQEVKGVQMNKKLKRSLQGIKDKIHRVVNEKPDLFDGVSEDTTERLEHLISTIENQAAYINILQSERDQVQEQLSSPSAENSSSIVNVYQQQIHQLQQNLLEKDEQQSLLQENLNKVEAELEQIRNDYSSIVTEYELLGQQQTQESQNSQHEIQQLKAAADLKQSVKYEHVETQTDEDINALHELIEEQSQQMKDLNEMTSILSSQLESQMDINKQKKELEERLNERDSHIERLMEERTNLLQEIAKSTPSLIETADNESQTEDRLQEKSTRANYKLKRSLQVVKEKIQDIVTERPDLFDDIGEDTNERLDHLISTVQNQAAYITILRSERDRVEEPLQNSMQRSQQEPDTERQTEIEQLTSSAPSSSSSIMNDYQQQIHQLQQNLSEKDEERSLLRERLNEVEVEFRKTLDDHASTQNKYELLAQQQTQELQNSRHEIEQLKGEVAELKQLVNSEHVETQTDEDINALHELIEEQSQQIKDLGEINNEKKDLEERLSERETHIQNLMEEITNTKSSSVEATDNESQTDELQEGKLAQVNKKLKRSLQVVKDKVDRLVSDKPDLFDGVGEGTNERLEHLISTIENQTAYINILQSERDQAQEQLQNSSVVDDYQQQIHQLQENLSEKDQQQSLLQVHLNEVQADLEKIRDDHTSSMTKHELLVQQQTQESQHSQHEIQQLKEAAELKQSVRFEHIEIQTDEDVNALHELIEEQSQQIKDLGEINNEKKELEERLNEREGQIKNLIEEIANSKSSHVETTDNECQTEELQDGKGAQMNKKLKRSLQVVKDKVDRMVSDKPDLFDGIGEETNERLDHLIATVENQAAYINILQNERDQAQEQLQK